MNSPIVYLLTCCLFCTVPWSTSGPASDHNVGHRTKRSAPTLANRTACNPGDPKPATRINTTSRLTNLRTAMTLLSIDAFIILSRDAHASEYIADRDKRLELISGFSETAGYAAVTQTAAAFWTDGRYYLEAEDNLDCNWIFMKEGQKDVPSLTQWLTTGANLPQSAVVGADPFLVANSESAGCPNCLPLLYMHDKNRRLSAVPSDNATTHNLTFHLNTDVTGQSLCDLEHLFCIEVRDYNHSQLLVDIRATADSSSDHNIWITDDCNYAIYNAIPQAQRVVDRSYIALVKAVKNTVERKGMQTATNRDSAAVMEFLARLDKEVKDGTHQWTELSAAEALEEMQSHVPLNRGQSLATTSASGANGAHLHYRPTNHSNHNITTDHIYLLESGGQYVDGTTHVTRTMHFGPPTAHQIECYTRVLMRAIDLTSLVWPEGLYGHEIDMAARSALWRAGLEYSHDTGHGIGAYLSVHEGPSSISLVHAASPAEETLRPNMFFSAEPGYYEPGAFGIRLGNIVMVETSNVTHKPEDKQFLRFKPITLVPFEPKLINYNMLSKHQINWLNAYHQLTRDTMEPLLTSQLVKTWLGERTQPYIINDSPRPAAQSLATRPVCLGYSRHGNHGHLDLCAIMI